MAYISKVNVPGDQTTYDIKSKKTAGIPFGQVDSSSTSTAFTATVDGITELYDGVCCYLRNGVVTSASGFTININGLGAKPVYSSMAAATALTTVFNINYTALLIYNSSRVSGGCWDFYYGYYTSSNTIGYQLRTNSSTRPVTSACYRYRICFSNADNTKWVPANASTSTNATSSRTVTTTPIDPFGRIVYYGYTTAISSGGNLGATYQWDQYALTLGYSFNRTGAALVLTYPAPVYIKCAPQSDGTAIIDADNPYVQALPSTADGKIYIYLGQAYSATQVEMTYAHPVYEYKDGHVRLWTNAAVGANVTVTPNRSMGNSIATINGTDILAYDVYDADLGTIGTFPNNLVPLDGTSAQYTNSSWSTISSELIAAIIAHQDVFVHGTIYADDDSSLLPLTFKLKHLSNVSVDLDFMPVFSGIAVDGTGTNPTSVIIGIFGDTVSIACVRLQGKLEIEDSVVENSANPVTSGAVYTELQGKQDTLTFDTYPTPASTNPVTSGGVYTGLSNTLSSAKTLALLQIANDNSVAVYDAGASPQVAMTFGEFYEKYITVRDIVAYDQHNRQFVVRSIDPNAYTAELYCVDYSSPRFAVISLSASGNTGNLTGTYSEHGLQSELSFDSAPTQTSTNPVTSGGVYSAIQNVPGCNTIDVPVRIENANHFVSITTLGYYEAVNLDQQKVIIPDAKYSEIVSAVNAGKDVTVRLYNESDPQPGSTVNFPVSYDPGDNAIYSGRDSCTLISLRPPGPELGQIYTYNFISFYNNIIIYATLENSSWTEGDVEFSSKKVFKFFLYSTEYRPSSSICINLSSNEDPTTSPAYDYSSGELDGAILYKAFNYISSGNYGSIGFKLNGRYYYLASFDNVSNYNGMAFNIYNNIVYTLLVQLYANDGVYYILANVTGSYTLSNNYITSSDVPTYETDPTVPSWAKASTKPTYTASEVGALPNTGEAEFTGASSVLILKGGAAENSPALRFQRGTLTDNYNDWQMQDRGGFLYFEQRGNGSSAWTEIAHFDTTGNLYCTGVKAYLDWSYVTNKPTIPTVDATPTSGSTNAVSSGGVYDMIGDVETLLASI